jgi:TDG/mug DNA glycosylase family protein
VVARPTRAAAELTDAELRAGAGRLAALVADWAPVLVCVLGLGAYRTAFAAPKAGWGLQPAPLAGRPVWLLPNPSGLNAHHQLPELALRYRAAHEHAEALERVPRRR